MSEAIRKAIAINICRQIQAENSKHWISMAKLQCWGCVRFSKGESEKMCYACREDNRGCNLVNRIYDKQNNQKK